MAFKNKNNLVAWLLLGVLMLTWGSSFILIKKGLTVFTSMQVGALRVSIAFLVLLPFAIAKFKQIDRRLWRIFIFISLCTIAPPFLFPMAQVGIDSGTASVLNSLTPLFTLIVGLLFFRLQVKWVNVLGVIIGFVGAVGLISVSGGTGFTVNFGYAVFIIIATIFYALNSNLIKYHLQKLDAFTITIFSFYFLGLPILIYLFSGTDFIARYQTHPKFWEGLAYVAILSIAGSVLALIGFNYLIKISTVVFASSVTYLIPVVAVLLGVLDGEVVGWTNVLWIFCILLGVFFVNRKKKVPTILGSKRKSHSYHSFS